MTDSGLMARPPFDQMVRGTEGTLRLEKSPELAVLNLADLSAIAAVHGLRILLEVTAVGWVLTWKPSTPEKPWGVFA